MEKNNYNLNIEEFSLYLQAEKIFSEGTILLYKTVLERFFQFCSQNQNERAETIVLLTPQILDDGDRSSWGYRYNPSPDALQMMERGQPRPR